jgi:hypothetical protein
MNMPSPDEKNTSKRDKDAVDPRKPFPDGEVKPYSTDEDAKRDKNAIDPGKPFPDGEVKP